MSFLRQAMLKSRVVAGLSSVESGVYRNDFTAASSLFRGVRGTLTVEGRRGIKTTDTAHPEPVYIEDERILRRVLDERHQQNEDLPIGMANPYERPKKKCILCEYDITPNYKNIKLLYQFVSPYTGMTYERHITGLCKTKHEQLVREIVIANNLGLMSNYLKMVEFLKDPKLCDPERPIKPHKY